MKTTLVLIYILCFLVVSCGSNSQKESVDEPGPSLEFLEEYQISSLPMLDTVSYIKDGRRLQDWRNYNFRELSLEQKQALRLDTIVSLGDKRDRRTSGPDGLDNLITEISNKLPISANFSTYIFFSLYRIQPTYTLITYDTNYRIIDAKLIGQFNDSRHKLYRYITKSGIRIRADWYDGNRSNIALTDYLIDTKGKITQLKEVRPSVKPWGRVVKAKNGLIIRDSLGEKIGKYNFGEFAIIKGYSEDSISIVDNGKTIKGRKAEVILDYQKYLDQLFIPTNENNLGYVFEGYLFENSGSKDSSRENPFGDYEYLAIGQGESANVKLNELFKVEKVTLQSYKNNITKIATRPKLDTTVKKKGKIEIFFENGTNLVLKDTTYSSEYNPTRSFTPFLHEDFKGSYLIRESMFFTPDVFSEISKINGDTLNTFNAFPFLSPNKLFSVSVSTEFECIQETYITVKYLDGSKYKHFATVLPRSWSYPYKLNSNGTPVDDLSLYWLSDKEFILKVKNPEGCDLGEVIESFYLKFKIKF